MCSGISTRLTFIIACVKDVNKIPNTFYGLGNLQGSKDSFNSFCTFTHRKNVFNEQKQKKNKT